MVRGLRMLIAVVAIVGACKKASEPSPATGSSGSSGDSGATGSGTAAISPDGGPTPSDATTIALADAALDAAIDLAAAVWPTWIQSTIKETKQKIGEVELDISLPRFQTRPDAIGKELDARFAPLAELGVDPKKHQGSLSLACTRKVVNRLVAIVECDRMRDVRTLEEYRAGTGGAPAGPKPIVVAVWLQPGLPPIRVDELAPGIDPKAASASLRAGAPSRCASECTFAPEHFVIDEDGGIRFVPTEYCDAECAVEFAPRIALESIKPTHLWAKKLYAWIHERLDANGSLVK